MSDNIDHTPAGSSTSANSNGSSQRTTGERIDSKSYARFDMSKDNPSRLSWLDRKRLARRLGIKVTSESQWEADLKPRVTRRLEMIRRYTSPDKNSESQSEEERRNKEQLDRLRQRKRKREQEEEHDRQALERLQGGSQQRRKDRETRSDRQRIGARNIDDDLNEADNNTIVEIGTLNPTAKISIHTKEYMSDEDSKSVDEILVINSIPSFIKRGKGREGRRTKVGKHLFESMRTELQMKRDEIVPIQIAEALFDFDIGKLIKYAVLLVPAVQRKYAERRQAHRPSKKSNRFDMLSTILDEKIIDDPIAEAVMGENEFGGIMSIASVVKDYAAPLVEVAWDPILNSPFSTKMRKFMVSVEQDEIIDIEGWRTIFNRTWAEMSIKAVSVAHNFVGIRKFLDDANLSEIFEQRKTKLLYEKVSRHIMNQSRNNNGHEGSNHRKPRRWTEDSKPREGHNRSPRDVQRKSPRNVQSRAKAFEKLRDIFGSETRFDREFFIRWAQSKHGGKNCLVGCLDPSACNRGTECPFSHNYKTAFPRGVECIKGTCDCV